MSNDRVLRARQLASFSETWSEIKMSSETLLELALESLIHPCLLSITELTQNLFCIGDIAM